MKHKLKLWHWVLIVTAAVLVLLTTAVGIWWGVMDVESFSEGWSLIQNLSAPPANDVYYKDSYTASDKKAQKWADKVVATVGDRELTNGQLQVYYWMEVYTYLNYNGQYAISKGLDYSLSLDRQYYDEFGGTWQQYFLDMALDSWHEEQSLALTAEAEGMTLSAEAKMDLENLRKELAASVAEGGYTSIDAMLQHDMGAGCDYDDYYSYRYTYTLANTWFTAKSEEVLDQMTDADVERFYFQIRAELNAHGVSKTSGLLYSVRHILLEPPGGAKDSEGNMNYTEEEYDRCRQDAQKLLDQWLEEGGGEELFAQYANDYSADEGSNTEGGLYEGLKETTDILEEFVEWYSDPQRKIGDYGLVRTSRGYHIMYLSDMAPEWEVTCRKNLLNQLSEDFVEDAVCKYPLDVTYKNIVLSVVDLTDLK